MQSGREEDSHPGAPARPCLESTSGLRKELEQGAAELGVLFPDHIAFVLEALCLVAAEVGLDAAP